MEANLSATTVVTPAKCALGHWPTYTHYCWRTENHHPLFTSFFIHHLSLPLSYIKLYMHIWWRFLEYLECSEISGCLLTGFSEQFSISFILEDCTAFYCLWVQCVWILYIPNMCVCVCQSSGQLCDFTHPRCEGGTISDSTLCPLPRRHSFHPTWQNVSLLFLSPHFSLLPLLLSFTWLM